jgi:hypothetical protein
LAAPQAGAHVEDIGRIGLGTADTKVAAAHTATEE